MTKFKKNTAKIPLFLIVLTISFSIAGCFNNSERINKMATDSLDDSILIYKKAFDAQYQKLIEANKMDSNIRLFTRLKDSINELANYVSVLENELHNLNENSTEEVRKIFIDNHAGDSIFNKLNRIFVIAKKNTTSVSQQEYLKKEESAVLSDHDVNSWTNALFGSNTPMAVIWFLKSVQSEVYKIGLKVFFGT